MSLFRSTLLAGTLLLAGNAHATEVDMAGGVSFNTPDNWVPIMETQGDPEVRVFQVPDPSPTASRSLARVSVTVKQVDDLAAFERYVAGATQKAKTLAAYQPAGQPDGPNSYAYTAQESGSPYRYSERYWFRNNRAIQLRCVRPDRSEAGAAWASAFDKGCDAIAADLAR
ncbi:hypothetical protein [Fulvimonas yonginensis]|uniref:CNP1-like family protein n=1 Tax=Fulvimonas yonginensis TaxID=1495200 RepID=A0ABU8JGR4_9GAMM